MGKIIEQKIDTFDGGMVSDPRSTTNGVSILVKNFDANKHRLVPYRSSETGNDTASRKISDFAYASGKLWGLGVDADSDPTIFYKDTFTDGTWSTTANNTADTTDNRVTGCLVHYKGFLYGYAGTTDVFKYDITGSAVWAHAASIAHNGRGVQGIVHSKDDSLYLAGTRKIYRNANAADGAWNSAVLTLPDNLTINSICEYGNYLAIACSDNDSVANPSKVFLWDRDSSVTTLDESIDWGTGTLKIIEELEGKLIGISLKTDSTLTFKSEFSFKYYAGAAGAVEFAKIKGTVNAFYTFLGIQKQKINNRIYFPASFAPEDGTEVQPGIFSVGRNSPTSPLAVTIEYRPANDTGITALDGFFLIGGYMFVAYSVSGSLDGSMSKTDNSETYSATSVYESVILNAGESSLTKKLIGVTVTHEPLPTAGSVVLKYRINEETSWTTIFTHTTDNSVSHGAINIESSGATLPEYKEIRFQIQSTGGAVITGLSYKAEIMDKSLY